MIAIRKNYLVSAVLVAVSMFASGSDVTAQVAKKVSAKSPTMTTARVVSPVDNEKRATLSGHVRPFLGDAVDSGRVADSQKTGPIMLLLSRTAKQQADLDALVDQMHNNKSSSFHQWLTPEQFGAKFQPADSDVAAVKSWLQSEGFNVLDVVPSKTHIAFSGTVGQLRKSFGVEMHHISINGESHMATINEPSIPAALAPVIAGLNKLDDFSPKPLVKPFGAFNRDLKTGKVTSVPGKSLGPVANLTGSESGSPFYEMGPQDFYTIYNENPLLNAGITGAGQTIAVIEETAVVAADVNSFRSVFGLPAYPATPNATQGGVNYMYGSASGLGAYASCLSPVPTTTSNSSTGSGEESEADIDLQWAGAVAPNATIDFVACGGTNGGDGSSPGAYGTDRAAQYVVNYLSSTVVAASMSYGECEADLSSTNMAYYNGQWEQYAAEGITAVVSTGDGGAEQCYQNSKYATTLPPSVNGFGSSAYNVAAGGTDFGDLYETLNYTTTPVTTWWNATNGAGQSSAVTYVPETTWAGYCSGQLYSSYLQKKASTTYGSVYTPQAICSSSAASTNGIREVVGGAGGISTYNAIPSWQSVYGVGLNSVSTTKRNLPDVSLFASNGWWGHFLPYCESDYYACSVADYTAGDMGAGGTSYVAPQLAGLMALIAQQTGSRQGQADYTFYNLAAQEYGTASTPTSTLASCSGSAVAPGQRPPAACIFYDISNDMPNLNGGTITPGIYQPCRYSNGNCYASNGSGGNLTYGVNIVPGTTVASGILGYTASPGYDDATGLGSFNFTALVQGWNSVSAGFASTTALSSSGSISTTAGSTTLTASVAATGRGGIVAPAGTVTFYLGSTTGTSLGTGTLSSTCTGTGATTSCAGVATLSVSASSASAFSTPGTYSIIASFGGDGANDAPSTSTATSLKVYGPPVGNIDLAVGAASGTTTVPQSDSLYVSGWAADPIDGSPLTKVAVYIDGASIGSPTLNVSRPDVASASGNSAYGKSGFVTTYAASSLSVGSHTVTVSATDSYGLTTYFQTDTFAVAAGYQTPVGNIDTVVGAATGNTTIPQSDSLYVSGWAADPSGAALTNVAVYVDGTVVGTTTATGSRPDVTAYPNSGFVFTYPATTLSIGSHTVTVSATNQAGVAAFFQTFTINVAAPYKAPTGNFDEAVDSASGGSPVHTSNYLYMQGWAADYQADGQVASVTVVIDGNVSGTATLGQSRPDVATANSDPNWGTTGWVYVIPAAGLSIGNHTVKAYATDHTGLITWLNAITINVVTP